MLSRGLGEVNAVFSVALQNTEKYSKENENILQNVRVSYNAAGCVTVSVTHC